VNARKLRKTGEGDAKYPVGGPLKREASMPWAALERGAGGI